jgi:excisionase family DNA binding protein
MTAKLELLTVREVAAWLRVSPGLVYRLVRERRLRTVRVASVVRVVRDSVHDYLRLQQRAYRPKGARATFGRRTAARYRKGGR